MFIINSRKSPVAGLEFGGRRGGVVASGFNWKENINP